MNLRALSLRDLWAIHLFVVTLRDLRLASPAEVGETYAAYYFVPLQHGK